VDNETTTRGPGISAGGVEMVTLCPFFVHRGTGICAGEGVRVPQVYHWLAVAHSATVGRSTVISDGADRKCGEGWGA
jgi:hypothetical protein